MNGNLRRDIKPGLRVRIILKVDQQSGKVTEGIVKDILTRSPNHPHGIKVRLVDGRIGRVKEIIAGESVKNLSSIIRSNEVESMRNLASNPFSGEDNL